LIGLGVLAALLVAAALIAPSFVDWNQFKGEIAARVREATGRTFTLEGNVALSLLPTPRLSVAGVRLANLPGAANPDMVRLKALDAHVAFAPLLEGRIQIESLDLVEPQVILERLADGRTNWDFGSTSGAAAPQPSGATRQAPSAGASQGAALPPWLQLDHLTISNGTLTYADGQTGETQSLKEINGGLSAGTSVGPFRAQLRAAAGKLPLAIDISLERLIGGRPSGIGLRVSVTGAQLDLTGSVADGKAGPEFLGKLRVTSANVGSALATLKLVDIAAIPPLFTQSVAVDGTIDATATKIAVNQLAMRLGDSAADGSITFEPGAPKRVAASFALSRIDLDKLLALSAPPASPGTPNRTSAASSQEGGQKSESQAAPSFKLPGDVEATLDVNMDGLLLRGGVVRQVHFGVALNKGELALTRLTAELPGGSDVILYGAIHATGAEPSFTGNLEAASDNLRGLLDWLKLDVSKVPAERLRKLALSSAVQLTPSRLQLRDVDMALDSSNIVGGATVLLESRPAFGVSVAIDRLNLDAYLPQPAAGKPAEGASTSKPALQTASSSGTAATPADPLRLLGAFDANLRARIDELIYQGERIRGIRMDGTVQGGNVTLREARVDDLAGLKGALSGTLTGAPPARKIDATFDASAAQLAPFLRFAGLESPVPTDQLGALAAKGHVRGDLGKLSIELDGGAMGGTYKLAGTLGLANGTPDYDLSVTVKQPQLARVVRLVVAEPGQADLGSLDLTAHVSGNGDGIAISGLNAQSGLLSAAGDAAVHGYPQKPALAANLTASTQHLGTLLALAGAKEPKALDGLGTVQAALKADGDAKGFTLDGKLSTGGGSAAIVGHVVNADKGPSYEVTLTAEHPELASLIKALLPDYHPTAAGLGALKLQAKVTGDEAKADVADLHATIGAQSISGHVDATLSGARPKVTARLETNDFDLNPFLPAEEAQKQHPRGQAQVGASSRWSTAPIDLASLKRTDAELALASASLTYQQFRVENAKLALAVDNGVLTLAGLTGKLYGGDLKISGKLDGQAEPKANLSLRLDGANLGDAGLKLGDVKLANGVLAVSADLATTGSSELTLVRGLGGNGALRMTNGVIRGLDLPAMNARLAKLDRSSDLLGLVQAVTSGGETKVTRLDGTFAMKDGVAENKDLMIEADGASGKGEGNINLPLWYMTYSVAFKLAGVGDAPPFTIELKGAPDQPRKFLKANELQEYLLKRTANAVLKDAGKGKAGGLSDLIKALPGGQAQPQSPAPAAQPQPTPPAAAQAQPSVPPAPPAQPSPPTPKQPSADTIIKNLLKGLKQD
jgi:uncharacterized protein involved in outer membrane biogenesis